MFFCKFCKIFKNIFSFDETPLDNCFLCLSVNFEKFFRTLHLYSTPLGNCLFHVQITEFQPPDTHCLFQQFIACDNRTQSPVLFSKVFQILYIFAQIFIYFALCCIFKTFFCPFFFALFLKKRTHALTQQTFVGLLCLPRRLAEIPQAVLKTS